MTEITTPGAAGADLAAGILQIYPDADMTRAIVVQDDGAGPYVARWVDDRRMPTVDEIAAAVSGLGARRKIAEVKREAERRIIQAAPLWRQINALGAIADPTLGGDRAKSRTLILSVNAIRAAADAIEEQIKAAADPESVDVETNPLWP